MCTFPKKKIIFLSSCDETLVSILFIKKRKKEKETLVLPILSQINSMYIFLLRVDFGSSFRFLYIA